MYVFVVNTNHPRTMTSNILACDFGKTIHYVNLDLFPVIVYDKEKNRYEVQVITQPTEEGAGVTFDTAYVFGTVSERRFISNYLVARSGK